MNLGTRTKQTWEEIDYVFQYGNALGDDTISTVTALAETSLGADATATVVTSANIVDTDVVVRLKAGTNGETYKVTSRATTSSGQKFEDEFYLVVADI